MIHSMKDKKLINGLKIRKIKSIWNLNVWHINSSMLHTRKVVKWGCSLVKSFMDNPISPFFSIFDPSFLKIADVIYGRPLTTLGNKKGSFYTHCYVKIF